MSFNQWVDNVTDKIYDKEGIRIATEMAESVKCPARPEQAHEFIASFAAHAQWELNGIGELAKRGKATADMNTPYIIPFLPEPKEGDIENCSMWDIAEKVKAFNE